MLMRQGGIVTYWYMCQSTAGNYTAEVQDNIHWFRQSYWLTQMLDRSMFAEME